MNYLRKIAVFVTFIAGLFLEFYGFFLTATVQGLIIMLFGVVALVTSLFLYNNRA